MKCFPCFGNLKRANSDMDSHFNLEDVKESLFYVTDQKVDALQVSFSIKHSFCLCLVFVGGAGLLTCVDFQPSLYPAL